MDDKMMDRLLKIDPTVEEVIIKENYDKLKKDEDTGTNSNRKTTTDRWEAGDNRDTSASVEKAQVDEDRKKTVQGRGIPKGTTKKTTTSKGGQK